MMILLVHYNVMVVVVHLMIVVKHIVGMKIHMIQMIHVLYYEKMKVIDLLIIIMI